MKVKELLEYLKDHEDFEIEIFTRVYTLDSISVPEKVLEIGKLSFYDRELWDKKIILEFIVGEALMYMSDIDFCNGKNIVKELKL